MSKILAISSIFLILIIIIYLSIYFTIRKKNKLIKNNKYTMNKPKINTKLKFKRGNDYNDR